MWDELQVVKVTKIDTIIVVETLKLKGLKKLPSTEKRSKDILILRIFDKALIVLLLVFHGPKRTTPHHDSFS